MEQRKHSLWNILVLARITKSFLVKTVPQEAHRTLYSLNKGNIFISAYSPNFEPKACMVVKLGGGVVKRPVFAYSIKG